MNAMTGQWSGGAGSECRIASPRTLVLAHRGLPTPGRPENTVAAISAALAAGADGVEIDVRITADGVLLCSHDADLSRIAGRNLTLAGSRASALRRVRLPGGHRIATLVELLAAASQHGRRRVIVEAKPCADTRSAQSTALALRDVLCDFTSTLDLTVSSFDPALLGSIREALENLEVRTGLLGSPFTPVATLLRQAVEEGHDEIHPHVLSVLKAPDVVHAAHSLDVGVTGWTVNRRRHVVASAALGIDAMITDDAPGVRSVLSAIEPIAAIATRAVAGTVMPGRR
jgi:glycerophosphoryl diester phosphodiesterase